MRIYILFFFIVFIVSSCNNNNQVEIINKNEGKLKSTYGLVINGEKKYNLDSETPTKPPYIQLYQDSTGKQLLAFLNSFKNSIYIYDYKTCLFQNKIEYDREGASAIMRIAGFYIKNIDSIYIYNMPMTEVVLADSKSRVKSRLSLRTSEPDWPDKYPQYLLKTVNPFIFVDNKTIYLTGQTFKSLSKNNIERFKFTACINTLNNDVKFNYTYPAEIYGSNSNWEEGIATQVYPTLSHDGKILHSYPASHDIYIRDLNSDSVTKVYGGSNFASTIRSIDYDDVKRTPSKLCLIHFLKQDLYGGIIYDKFRKVYYRFVECKIPEATLQNTLNEKTINVIIMNEKFQYLGETKIGTGKEWNWSNSFVTEEGLNIEYIDRDDLDEEFLNFKILKLERLL